MSFHALIAKVEQAEQALEVRERRASAQWQQVKTTWRESWTPGRIVIAGLVSGFLAGRAEPLRAMNGARWMQMFTAVSSFLATAQAAAAAETAEQAADTAQEAQEQADVQADEEPLVDEAFDEDEIVVTAPRPAEAATELSER